MSSLSISVFQANARDESPEARLNWLDMAAERAADGGSRVLICPELYLSGYLSGEKLQGRARPMQGEYAERVGEIALLHNIAIAYTYPESHGNILFNSAGFVTPDGTLIAHHRKNHLPSDYEKKWFTPDHNIAVFDYAGWKMALLICYDIEFAETARQASLAGAELLIVPTALSADWPFVAEKMIPVRAFENGTYLAYANFAGREKDLTYLGGSRIIGPDGAEEAVAGKGEQIIMATLEKSRIEAARTRLPYLADRQSYDR
jgi:predicted amidohydrolase